eukprot:1589291-Pleurochrysis_carterae.AAC.1
MLQLFKVDLLLVKLLSDDRQRAELLERLVLQARRRRLRWQRAIGSQLRLRLERLGEHSKQFVVRALPAARRPRDGVLGQAEAEHVHFYLLVQ